MAYIDEYGYEVLDETPVAVPLKFSRPPTIQEQVALLVRTQLSQRADSLGMETFEEADDFDVDDEDDISSPYEEHFDHHKNINDLVTKINENKKLRLTRKTSVESSPAEKLTDTSQTAKNPQAA